MTSRAICVAVLLSTLPAAGCGTVANLARSNPGAGGLVPFGGVKQDVACLHQANGGPGARAHHPSEPEQYPQVAAKFFCAADLPFSLIGDLVTWPYVAVYSFINQPVPTPLVTLAEPVVTQPISIPPVTRPMPIPIPPLPLPTPESRPKPPAPDPQPNPIQMP